ncbi:TldD/PmbA family protein [Sphingomicrobium marinum]|uniref:TldD/PmbA family protein n=1 Tax=Sphingomicrobium marinum TaxID=1227950 RepID=UPI00223EC70C|nr:metallopeptidase TldD-related protein [Sphingomicrobium marinum]
MIEKKDACDFAAGLVEKAIKAGASAADAAIVATRSSEVEVRDGELEDVSRSEGRKYALRVFDGQRMASVSGADLDGNAQSEIIARALAMAREAPEDPYAGLAPQDMLMTGDAPDVDIDDGIEPDPEALKERALAAEAAALAVEGVTQSTGSSATAAGRMIAIATSHGFVGGYSSSSHNIYAGALAADDAGKERDSHWHGTRHLEDLESAEEIGRIAGERAVARLNPTKPKAGRMPVLFDPKVANTLLGHLAGAIDASAVARRTSFLKDMLGERVFAEGVDIIDDPLRPRGVASHPFDGEGLPVARVAMVEDGILKSWFASSTAARQLGIRPTGHAKRGISGSPGAGPSNFVMQPGARSREELLGAFPQALLVTELIGHGTNLVTGDYSRGAAGFLVENGEIGRPVSEITIASNLKDMFATLEPGNDLELRRGTESPTLLVPEMTVAAG